ncbi:MAG: efflux RND transporter periplasmic adaptor subunit [Proteobacteria bacterium]|nr:efflux RND transporter periplasmic adaptor subunit [Pseudomonadota bacterium]
MSASRALPPVARWAGIAALTVALLLPGVWMLWPKSSSGAPTAPERPALAVTAGKASIRPLRSVVQASGAIAAWQEGSIGARISGLPVVAVDVNVGDVVKKGQVLARLDDAVVLTEMRQAEANLAAAQAAARQAAANRDRALTLKATGALSDQDILQSTTLAATGEAQVAQARAALEATQLKLRYTRLIAPDDGVISSRTAALGLISQSGTELFRFIRQGRLEWRAELTASQVTQVQPGQDAELQLPDGHAVTGRVRQLSPQLSQDTRLALAYVDLDAASVISSGARAGMYGSGEIRLGMNDAITVPAESVVIRDGRSYVMRLDGSRAKQVPVTTGRREGSCTEILKGLSAGDAVVVRGAGFVSDNDLVHVIDDRAGNAGTAPARAGAARGS